MNQTLLLQQQQCQTTQGWSSQSQDRHRQSRCTTQTREQSQQPRTQIRLPSQTQTRIQSQTQTTHPNHRTSYPLKHPKLVQEPQRTAQIQPEWIQSLQTQAQAIQSLRADSPQRWIRTMDQLQLTYCQNQEARRAGCSGSSHALVQPASHRSAPYASHEQLVSLVANEVPGRSSQAPSQSDPGQQDAVHRSRSDPRDAHATMEAAPCVHHSVHAQQSRSHAHPLQSAQCH